MEFIDVIIYILASFGLLFTIISIIQSYNNFIPYYVQNIKKNNYNEITIKLIGINNKDINKSIERIRKGEFNNIYEMAEDVKIIISNWY